MFGEKLMHDNCQNNFPATYKKLAAMPSR